MISIHALREEGDVDNPAINSDGDISIHALREEGDLSSIAKILRMLLFLSTPSARRATKAVQALQAEHRISIHALREEGDKSN